MATTGHESEFVTVSGLKGSLQQYKTSISDTKLNAALKGAVNGVAELDTNGKVPSSQLPSYVDDVIEGYYYNRKFYKESSHTTEITGEGGKIYVDLTTGSGDKTYRWSGSAYVQIKGDLTIGTTTGSAADGKVVDDHIKDTTVHITAAERTAWNAKGSYSKPSGGIPKTDLAEAVQTSLGKADNALTSHASRKLTVTNGTATSTSGEITFVESVNGAQSGSTGDITATTTRKKVTIPAAQVQTDWNATTGMGVLLNKPTLGNAAAKGVTDNTSATEVTSTDTNLITGRTLYYAGYTKNAGTVTGVKINGTTMNPTSGVVNLGTVITDISGKQDRVGALGSKTQPLYTSATGTFAACDTYAGGTAVTLNGTSKAKSTASFYAPTGAGTSGQVLVADASGVPTWGNVASVQTCQDIISELT